MRLRRSIERKSLNGRTVLVEHRKLCPVAIPVVENSYIIATHAPVPGSTQTIIPTIAIEIADMLRLEPLSFPRKLYAAET